MKNFSSEFFWFHFSFWLADRGTKPPADHPGGSVTPSEKNDLKISFCHTGCPGPLLILDEVGGMLLVPFRCLFVRKGQL
jgi:hypothetical protein